MSRRVNPVRDTKAVTSRTNISNGVNFLAVDASSSNLSLYIRYGKDKRIDFNRRLKFGASRLVTLIDRHLKKSNVDLSGIDALVLGAGPGSFTGLRISFSVIKALMMALKKPAILIPSFYSCAYQLKNKAENLVVVADARRNLVYSAHFKPKQRDSLSIGRVRLTRPEEFLRTEKDRLFATYDRHLRKIFLNLNPRQNFYPQDVYPRAKYLMPLAELYYNKGKFTPLEKLNPLYLHPKTCQIRSKHK